MDYLKKIYLIMILSLTIGCTKNNTATNTINYNLDIKTTFQEKITFTLPITAYDQANKNKEESYTNLEYSLLNEESEPINSNHQEKYNKKIKKEKDKVTILLDYNYKEDDFIYSNYIMNCFENYNLTSNEDSFSLELSGNFYCLNDNIINININTDYEVIESNGINTEKGYTWQINTNNYNNIDIKYEISRNYYDMEQISNNSTNSNSNKKYNNSLTIIKDLIIIILTISLLIILNKFYKKRQKT